MREEYKVIALLLKPRLGLFGLVGRHRVLLPHLGSATGHLIAPGDRHVLQHTQVHFGVNFQVDFEDVRWPSLETTPKTITVAVLRVVRCIELCHQALNRPDLHFEDAGNGPVVITWIGRDMSCTAAHLRSRSLNIVSLSDMIESSFHSWHLFTTSRWSAAKKENRFFIKRKWNHVVFSKATILSFHPVEGSSRSWDLYTTGQLEDGLQQKKKTGFSLNENGIMSSFLGRQFYCSTP